ncbi:hypothetical protein BH24ACT5_BH24ACT5_03560 [soil metagenome]
MQSQFVVWNERPWRERDRAVLVDVDHVRVAFGSDELAQRRPLAVVQNEDPPWRRRKYTSPPVFGFTVRGPTEDFLVLWSRTEDTVVVEYVGTDI